jgi:hypothetical protein
MGDWFDKKKKNPKNKHSDGIASNTKSPTGGIFHQEEQN